MVFSEDQRSKLQALQTEAADWNALYGQLMDHASAVADAMAANDRRAAAKHAGQAIASAKALQRAVK